VTGTLPDGTGKIAYTSGTANTDGSGGFTVSGLPFHPLLVLVSNNIGEAPRYVWYSSWAPSTSCYKVNAAGAYTFSHTSSGFTMDTADNSAEVYWTAFG